MNPIGSIWVRPYGGFNGPRFLVGQKLFGIDETATNVKSYRPDQALAAFLRLFHDEN
jgi:hypothetical protein